MTADEEYLPFPEVDIEKILVKWDDCVTVTLGLVPQELPEKMEIQDFDCAPVFDGDTLLGLISRERLQELAINGHKLADNDHGIVLTDDCEVRPGVRLDALLSKMAERAARIVLHEGDAGDYGPLTVTYGLLTRSDLNRHPVRVTVYQLLAALEMALADLVRKSVSDHLTWIKRLREDSQARILGYWELSKLKGVDTGPVAGATLSDLLNATAKLPGLSSRLGYKSRTAFDDAVGGIPDVRNQVMHPVRPLVTDPQSCLRIKAVLEEVVRLTRRVQGLSS